MTRHPEKMDSPGTHFHDEQDIKTAQPDGIERATASRCWSTLRRARQMGLLTILDSKRNDIASTAGAYADAAFSGTALDDMVLVP